MLLSADAGDDEGYFKERLAKSREQLLRAWQKRGEHLELRFLHTDILGALLLASQMLQQSPQGRRNVLVIFSDMRQNTSDLNLEGRAALVPSMALATAGQKGMIADLTDIQVYVLGADNAGRNIGYWNRLREFWSGYFSKSGAHLEKYSVLRDPVHLEP